MQRMLVTASVASGQMFIRITFQCPVEAHRTQSQQRTFKVRFRFQFASVRIRFRTIRHGILLLVSASGGR